MTRRSGTRKSTTAIKGETVLRTTIMLSVAAWMLAVIAIMSGVVPPMAGIPLFGMIASVLGIVIMTSSPSKSDDDNAIARQPDLAAAPQYHPAPQQPAARMQRTHLAVKRQAPVGAQRSYDAQMSRDVAPSANAAPVATRPYRPAPLPRTVPVPQGGPGGGLAQAPMPSLAVAPAPAPAPAPVRREIMASASPVSQPVLTRGTMEGRSYVVFADGSIELETAFGPRWFASVDLAHEFIGFRNGASVLLGAQSLDDELAQVA